MNIQQRVVGSSVVFKVSGAHTHRDAGALRTTVDQALRGGVRNVVIDLEEVSELGGAGLGELVSIYGAVRHAAGRLALSAVPRRIRYLLAATGLDTVFEMADSRGCTPSGQSRIPPSAPRAQGLQPEVAQSRSGTVYGSAHDAAGVAGTLADRVQVFEAVGNEGLAVAGQPDRARTP